MDGYNYERSKQKWGPLEREMSNLWGYTIIEWPLERVSN